MGLPLFVPQRFARATPVRTRSRIIAASNSEKTPNIWNIARPEGVEVSSAFG